MFMQFYEAIFNKSVQILIRLGRDEKGDMRFMIVIQFQSQTAVTQGDLVPCANWTPIAPSIFHPNSRQICKVQNKQIPEQRTTGDSTLVNNKIERRENIKNIFFSTAIQLHWFPLAIPVECVI